jgi:membrane protease YdiL (CAAX protease family)
VPPGERNRVFVELSLLWLCTLGAIRGVVTIQKFGLPDAVLAAVPFLFIYAPVWLCRWRNADSYAYRIAIPAFSDHTSWKAAFKLFGTVVGLIIVPWLLGYHLYQNLFTATMHAVGRIHSFDEGLQAACGVASGRVDVFGDHPWRTLWSTVHPHWRVAKDPWLLVPYHLFFVAIPEEFFYRGYFQTRLNEVFPRKFLIFGTPVGWGLPIACLYFAFGHSLVTVRWWHFATFFPGLVFGWMRERTGSPLAGALFHAWSNITVTWLDTFYGIRA